MESWNQHYEFNKVLREKKTVSSQEKNNSEFDEEDMYLNSLLY